MKRGKSDKAYLVKYRQLECRPLENHRFRFLRFAKLPYLCLFPIATMPKF
jgi:hypothetical protein